MKIVTISRAWPSMRGGGMLFVAQDRAKALAAAGHEVFVLTTSNSPTEKIIRPTQIVEVDGLTVIYTASEAHKWSKGFAIACIEWIKKLQPDVVHSDSFDRDRIYWLDLDVPFVVSMHGFGLGTWLTDWNLSRAYGNKLPPFPEADIKKEIGGLRKAKAVIGISKWEYRMLRDQYGLKSAKLVYNPISPYFFENVPAYTPNRNKFLCVAVSQGAKRGFKIAEEAAKIAGVELVFADCPREQMPELYDQTKAILLPSAFSQGMDLAVCEARARGVPAIMSPTGSYWDEKQPWDTHIEIGDTAGIAEVLKNYTAKHVPSDAADVHRPANHVRAWLEVVEGIL